MSGKHLAMSLEYQIAQARRVKRLTSENGRLRAEVATLNAEIDRLRAALQWQVDHYDPTSPEIAHRKAKEALLPNRRS